MTTQHCICGSRQSGIPNMKRRVHEPIRPHSPSKPVLATTTTGLFSVLPKRNLTAPITKQTRLGLSQSSSRTSLHDGMSRSQSTTSISKPDSRSASPPQPASQQQSPHKQSPEKSQPARMHVPPTTVYRPPEALINAAAVAPPSAPSLMGFSKVLSRVRAAPANEVGMMRMSASTPALHSVRHDPPAQLAAEQPTLNSSMSAAQLLDKVTDAQRLTWSEISDAVADLSDYVKETMNEKFDPQSVAPPMSNQSENSVAHVQSAPAMQTTNPFLAANPFEHVQSAQPGQHLVSFSSSHHAVRVPTSLTSRLAALSHWMQPQANSTNRIESVSADSSPQKHSVVDHQKPSNPFVADSSHAASAQQTSRVSVLSPPRIGSVIKRRRDRGAEMEAALEAQLASGASVISLSAPAAVIPAAHAAPSHATPSRLLSSTVANLSKSNTSTKQSAGSEQHTDMAVVVESNTVTTEHSEPRELTETSDQTPPATAAEHTHQHDSHDAIESHSVHSSTSIHYVSAVPRVPLSSLASPVFQPKPSHISQSTETDPVAPTPAIDVNELLLNERTKFEAMLAQQQALFEQERATMKFQLQYEGTDASRLVESVQARESQLSAAVALLAEERDMFRQEMAAQQEKWSAEHELRRTAWREREAALEQRQHALLLERQRQKAEQAAADEKHLSEQRRLQTEREEVWLLVTQTQAELFRQKELFSAREANLLEKIEQLSLDRERERDDARACIQSLESELQDSKSKLADEVAARGRAEEDRQHSDAVRQRLELELTAERTRLQALLDRLSASAAGVAISSAAQLSSSTTYSSTQVSINSQAHQPIFVVTPVTDSDVSVEFAPISALAAFRDSLAANVESSDAPVEVSATKVDEQVLIVEVQSEPATVEIAPAHNQSEAPAVVETVFAQPTNSEQADKGPVAMLFSESNQSNVEEVDSNPGEVTRLTNHVESTSSVSVPPALIVDDSLPVVNRALSSSADASAAVKYAKWSSPTARRYSDVVSSKSSASTAAARIPSSPSPPHVSVSSSSQKDQNLPIVPPSPAAAAMPQLQSEPV